jgi:glycine cleavage system T protein
MEKQGLLFEAYRQAGAAFVDVAGQKVPDHFGDPRGEYEAVRQAAGLIDLSHQGKIWIAGTDGQDFLNRMLTNDIKAMAPGRGCQTFLLNAKGHVVAYLVLLDLPDAFLAEAEPVAAGAMVEMLEHYVVADDVALEDVSEAWGLLSLQGPAAGAVLGDLLGGSLPALEPFQHVEVQAAGAALRLVSQSRTGETGYDMWVPADRAAALWQAATRAGARHGLRPVGLAALNVLRVEAGQAWAADVGGDVLAMETGLEGVISFSKGCYIGQEFVVRVAHRGHVNRKLSGLVLSGDRVPAPGDKVVQGEKEAGWITSAALSPALGRPIVLGYIRRECNAPGSKVAVQTGGSLLEAEVVTLPFLKTVRAFGRSDVR